MKIKLIKGIGEISNSNFTLKQGIEYDLPDCFYDKTTMVQLEEAKKPVEKKKKSKPKKKPKKSKFNYDLNGDGKVDKKDTSIAGKVLYNYKNKSNK